MASMKTLSIHSELDVHLSITKQGIGVTISGEEADTSFSEYTWDELSDDMIEQHAVPVLASNDYKISKDSRDFIKEAAQKMRYAASKMAQRTDNMDVVDIS